MHVQCPACGQTLEVGPEHEGIQTNCPICQEALFVPASSPDAAPAPAAEAQTPAASPPPVYHISFTQLLRGQKEKDAKNAFYGHMILAPSALELEGRSEGAKNAAMGGMVAGVAGAVIGGVMDAASGQTEGEQKNSLTYAGSKATLYKKQKQIVIEQASGVRTIIRFVQESVRFRSTDFSIKGAISEEVTLDDIAADLRERYGAGLSVEETMHQVSAKDAVLLCKLGMVAIGSFIILFTAAAIAIALTADENSKAIGGVVFGVGAWALGIWGLVKLKRVIKANSQA